MPPRDDEDRQYEATQKKLDEARARGELPRSTDLMTAAGYGGFLAVAVSGGGAAILAAGGELRHLLESPHRIARSGAAVQTAGGIVARVLGDLSIWVLGPAAAVVAIVFLQRAWVFAPEKLQFRLSRISPISNARQKFGRDGLFEFAKSTLKLVVISACLSVYLSGSLPAALATLGLEPVSVSAAAFGIAAAFATVVFAVAVVVGIVDAIWQNVSFLIGQRMSRKELTDEMKDTEGDPHIRQQRRQKGYDIATNRMIAEVPKADVVIVNPSHYAVALRWTREAGSAPVCVAKGVDEVALRIRRAAIEAGVPVRSDPPTARAIHAAVGVGEEIRPEHYRAVAAAIRFADALRRRAKARR